MNPTENKPELPAEVREAIQHHFAAFQWPEGTADIEEALHKLYRDLCAALAPLWPKPAPASEEVKAAVERLNEQADWLGSPPGENSGDAKAIRTVLAALADAQRDREQLRKAVRRVLDADNKGHACLFGYASELQDVVQEARR